METEQRTLWLEILGHLHTRLRQLALLGLVTLVAVVSDWFFQHQQLAEEQSHSEPQLQKLVTDSFTATQQSILQREIQLALTNPECLIASAPGTQRLKTGCIPSLSKSADISSKMEIYGRELPKILYRLIVIFAPVVLLLGTIATVVQLRRLHVLLRTEVSNLSVQHKLNSPYFSRVTTTYGEGWRSQTLIAAAISFVHVLAAFMYVPAVLILSNVVDLFILDGRILDARIGATSEGRPFSLFIIWFTVLLCTLILWVVVFLLFSRLIKPTDKTKESDASADDIEVIQQG